MLFSVYVINRVLRKSVSEILIRKSLPSPVPARSAVLNSLPDPERTAADNRGLLPWRASLQLRREGEQGHPEASTVPSSGKNGFHMARSCTSHPDLSANRRRTVLAVARITSLWISRACKPPRHIIARLSSAVVYVCRTTLRSFFEPLRSASLQAARALLIRPSKPNRNSSDLRSVRKVLLGGEPLSCLRVNPGAAIASQTAFPFGGGVASLGVSPDYGRQKRYGNRIPEPSLIRPRRGSRRGASARICVLMRRRPKLKFLCQFPAGRPISTMLLYESSFP